VYALLGANNICHSAHKQRDFARATPIAMMASHAASKQPLYVNAALMLVVGLMGHVL
jgi:hypothetical protein